MPLLGQLLGCWAMHAECLGTHRQAGQQETELHRRTEVPVLKAAMALEMTGLRYCVCWPVRMANHRGEPGAQLE